MPLWGPNPRVIHVSLPRPACHKPLSDLHQHAHQCLLPPLPQRSRWAPVTLVRHHSFQEPSMTSHRPLSSRRGALSSVAVLCITLAIAGCQIEQKKPDTAAPPASSERANEIRPSIQKSQPHALAGIVTL